jgi:hypothetical protein
MALSVEWRHRGEGGGKVHDADRLTFLLQLRARIEWDWSDTPRRDAALGAIDEFLRAPTDEYVGDLQRVVETSEQSAER